MPRTVLQSDDLKAVICHRGLRLASLRLAPFGREEELLATPDDLSILATDDHMVGALVGPYAHRIARASFAIDGARVDLLPNEGAHFLHGGPYGFHAVKWIPLETNETKAIFGLRWNDPEGRYPGVFEVRAECTMVHSALHLTIEACADQPTHFNPTWHPYFNLCPDKSPAILDHTLELNATRRLVLDRFGIPTGKEVSIASGSLLYDGTSRDAAMLDDCFICPQGVHGAISHPPSQRVLTIISDAPAAQVYTGHHLGSDRGSWPYVRGAGICLEPQHPPDSPNRPVCGPTLLKPGERYRRTITYAVGIQQ